MAQKPPRVVAGDLRLLGDRCDVDVGLHRGVAARHDEHDDEHDEQARAEREHEVQQRLALAVPELPEGWRANAAELRTSTVDGVTAWYVGYLTPSDEYIGMYQGLEANPTWVAGLLERTLATGTTTIEGIEWTVYDNRDSGDDVGNARYGLTTEAGGSTFVLLGTATPEEFLTLATALLPTIDAQQ